MTLSERIRKTSKRLIGFLTALSMCLSLGGCKSIIGDGEVNIVTAPPLVTPRVVAYDDYTGGSSSRFDIPGTDAFYLLPGIEDNPDAILDFACLDYTYYGYFIYYYCAPAYVSKEEIESYIEDDEKTMGIAPKERQTLDRSAGIKCDALILMGYNPDNRRYKVMDAQAFSRETANSSTNGNANTGVDFYKSGKYDFFTLSHAYGCKVNGSSNYFLFDQNGIVKYYDETMNLVGKSDIGPTITDNVRNVEKQYIATNDPDSSISEISTDKDDMDKAEKAEMEEAMDELSEVTGNSYESEKDKKVDDLKLNCLIKSAVADGTGQIYLSLMIYSGESPWTSEILINRVCSITSVDLTGDFTKFVSVNDNYEKQKLLYQNNAQDGITFDDIRNGYEGALIKDGTAMYTSAKDSFTPFFSDKAGRGMFIVGYPKADRNIFKEVFPSTYTEENAAYFEQRLGELFGGWIGDANLRDLAKKTPEERVRTIEEVFEMIKALPRMREYDRDMEIHRSDFPMDTDPWVKQILAVYDLGFDSKNTNAYRVPRAYTIRFDEKYKDEAKPFVYYEPYILNDYIPVYKKDSEYVADEAAALELVQRCTRYLMPDATIEDVREAIREYYDTNDSMNGVLPYLESIALLRPGRSGFVIDDGIGERDFGFAFLGRIRTNDTSLLEPDEALSIPDGTFVVSYRLVFGGGAHIIASDMDTAEGSATTSIPDGVLLFSDTAKQGSDGNLEYTSNVRYQRFDKMQFEDKDIEGAAIDSGALPYRDPVSGSEVPVLLLITDRGVKFYSPQLYHKGTSVGSTVLDRLDYSTDKGFAFFIKNEELLTSTGFTPYTESATQESVSRRNESLDLKERYEDDNGVEQSQSKMSLTLNSSRVGTLQSASSFTALNNNDILMCAYDTGLSLLRLSPGDGISAFSGDSHEVINLQGGSYYQSFATENDGIFKVIGFDTGDYMYGAMDISRAKVYDLDLNKERTEIFVKAVKGTIDQMAIDYVRRQYRTRVEIGEDAQGKPTGTNRTVILNFNDDHSEEAESERILFEKSEAEAKAELRKIAERKGAGYGADFEEYLISVREKVEQQKLALREIFEITGASVLSGADASGKNTSGVSDDVYWVALKERLQYVTELENLLDILAEIATSDDMLSRMSAEDAQTYRDIRKVLNYRKEDEEKNKALEVPDLSAKELDEMIDNTPSVSAYEEDYSSLNKDEADRPKDPLDDALKTDGVMKEGTKNDTLSRQEARRLIIEDIENNYFKLHPLEPEKVYAPDGSYRVMVTKDREDEEWQKYLEGLLSRINPDNLTDSRKDAAREFAELTYGAARVAQGEQVTSAPLAVEKSVQETMKQEVMEGIENCETIADMEALFFGTQVKHLGNPYASYRDAFTAWEKKDYDSESARAADMRAAEWYTKLRGIIDSDEQVKKLLESKNRTWDEYLAAVMTGKTGRVLRDEMTGDSAGADTTASSVFAQLVEFMCRNAGEVDREKKIEMVEDLLIGMQSLSGSNTAEEAVLVERMTLDAFKSYKSAYDQFNTLSFENNESGGDSIVMSTGAELRRAQLVRQDFYVKVIASMKSDPLLAAYLKENDQTWEQYMASLPVLAQNATDADPAVSARKVYETFVPFEVVDESNRPEASEGDEERPVIR